MKGLTTFLDKFSEGLRIRKILPTLLEEVHFPSSSASLTDVISFTDEGHAVAPTYSA